MEPVGDGRGHLAGLNSHTSHAGLCHFSKKRLFINGLAHKKSS
jgi:hypothetical protein